MGPTAASGISAEPSLGGTSPSITMGLTTLSEQGCVRREHCRGIAQKTHLFSWGMAPLGASLEAGQVHLRLLAPPDPPSRVLVRFNAWARAWAPRARRWRPRHWKNQGERGAGLGKTLLWCLPLPFRPPGRCPGKGRKTTLLGPLGPHAPLCPLKVCSEKLRDSRSHRRPG